MRKYLVTAMVLTSIGSFNLIGCDRASSEKSETTTSPNGATSTSTEKTAVHSDGTTTTEKSSKTANP